MPSSDILSNMRLLISGGTGFVGQHLASKTSRPLITTRSASKTATADHPSPSYLHWDAVQGPIDLSESPSLDAVVHLLGEPIAEGRWTNSKKAKIRDSRILGTRNLVTGILRSEHPPQVLVAASAVGIYGDAGEAMIDEQSPPGTRGSHGQGFLVEVCEAWEAEANRLAEHGVRVINLRIGIVLGSDGGALAQMVPLFRWGLGGRLGDGKQWVPWIHIEDLVNLILWCVQQSDIQGPVNATAPHPIRNATLTQELGRRLNRPTILAVPKIAAKLALGEFASSLFSSQRVLPAVALEHGFQFQFPELAAALQDLIT